jgi:hypothetical protein
MRYFVIFAAVLFWASICAAQSSTDFRAEGTVVDAETGQPLANARVKVGPGPGCRARQSVTATTADDGTFRIPLQTSGPFTACIQREGYISEWSLPLTQCSPCTPTFRIHAAANVSGRVLSAETKEPINRVLVEAIRVKDSFDIATSVTAASVRSFANGQFSLGQLLPGQYFFRFTPANPAPLLIDDGHDPTARQFAVQWWPGGDSSRGATPFTIMAGTSFQRPDMWIPAVPRFQVSGTVEPTICQAGDAYNVTIGEHRGPSVAMIRSMLIRCGAEFTFSGLAPRHYQINLLPKDGGEAVASEEAVVTDRDLQKDFPEVHATP